MTNQLVGDVYQKIIDDVCDASTTDFEESGVNSSTLAELKKTWKDKLADRGVAHMPWQAKPQPPPQQSQPSLSSVSNGMPQQQYQQYNGHQPNISNGSARVKTEPGTEQYLPNGLPTTTYPSAADTQGGQARAAQLMQQNFGQNANASISAMQQRGGLALPGQQQAKPQGLQLPAGVTQAAQQHAVQQQHQAFQQQQHAAMARQQQQQQLQQQQSQPRIKVENEQSGTYQQQQQQPRPPYQTDGADDGLEEWRNMLAERRATHAEQGRQADRMMRDHVLQQSENLHNGLMVPLEEQPSHPKNKKGRGKTQQPTGTSKSSSMPSVPQFDGGDEDDEDDKSNIKDEDDADAINSDLDDSDDENQNDMGEDDDEHMDNILCTYEKVQRVKNKWKCTLKDGVMSAGGKEWVFHKGMGEFEW